VETTLTPDYWSITLPSRLATSAARSPELFAYASSLCLLNARVPPFAHRGEDGEQKASIYLRDLFDPVVQPKKAPIERHHLFPRKYLEGLGISGTRSVNQIGNLAYVEWPDNIEVSDTAPAAYWPRYAGQFGKEDLFNHALPEHWHEMPYEEFLEARRVLLAKVIRAGFERIGSAPAIAWPRPGDEEVEERNRDIYLHPDRPFSNELAIRRLIRRLEGDILWYEAHMDRKALEILNDELPAEGITSVRLMSGPANLSSKTKRAFERFAEELASRDVDAQRRVLPAERARAFHARIICDDDETFEVPPLNSVLAGTVVSIRLSDMPLESFEDAWDEDGVPLGEYPTAS
jgi:hypothetical protein